MTLRLHGAAEDLPDPTSKAVISRLVSGYRLTVGLGLTCGVAWLERPLRRNSNPALRMTGVGRVRPVGGR